MSAATANTDVPLFTDTAGASAHRTKEFSLGISVGGNVIVMPLREWHQLAGMLAVAVNTLAADPPRETERVFNIFDPQGALVGAQTAFNPIDAVAKFARNWPRWRRIRITAQEAA